MLSKKYAERLGAQNANFVDGVNANGAQNMGGQPTNNGAQSGASDNRAYKNGINARPQAYSQNMAGQNATNKNAQNAENLAVDIEIPDDIFECEFNPTIETWGKTLFKMKEVGDNSFYAMCECVSQTRLSENGEFLLVTNDKFNYNDLVTPATFERLKGYLQEFTSAPIKVVFEEIVEDVDENIEYLKEKFGDCLKLKQNN